MPTKYTDRLRLPVNGLQNILLSTILGLKIANGYNKVIFEKKPLLQFDEKHLIFDNIFIPENQKWRIKNPNSQYIEYRSRDYCAVKIMQLKKDKKFYICPFKLKSDIFPVLIAPRSKA